jgi:hypothetical protein
MTGFVIILAALNLGVPVRCYEQPAWTETRVEHRVTYNAVAFYHAGEGRYIALSPAACLEVREATVEGALIIGHEFAHHWQDVTGSLASYDTNAAYLEREADRLSFLTRPWWQQKLRRHFGIKPPPPAIRLAP